MLTHLILSRDRSWTSKFQPVVPVSKVRADLIQGILTPGRLSSLFPELGAREAFTQGSPYSYLKSHITPARATTTFCDSTMRSLRDLRS